jgi:diguanylate cyclase (GGDEF)-like protein/PAS domain S-box-containing protein
MSNHHINTWHHLASMISDSFYIIEDRCFGYVNAAFASLLGTTPGAIIGSDYLQFVTEDDRERSAIHHRKQLKSLDVVSDHRVRLVHQQSGNAMPVRVKTRTMVQADSSRAILGVVTLNQSPGQVFREVDDHQSRLLGIMGNISDTVYQTNMQGQVTFISQGVEALLGYRPEEMLDTPLADYYWSPQERERIVQAIIQGQGIITNVEAILRRKDGSPVWISTNAYVKKDAVGHPVFIEGMARDVSRQKQLEQELSSMALTDSLTGLPNRRALMESLGGAFVRSVETGDDLSLIYCDVDRFKRVNDHYGHQTGDRLLCRIGDIMRGLESAQIKPGRLSGDEFLLILEGMDESQAARVAQQLELELQKNSLSKEDEQIPVSVSMGICQRTVDDANEIALLDRTDREMYQVKQQAFNP